MLDVYVDLGNIAGYLAIEPIKQLTADTQVSCRYLPIKGIVPRPLSREPKNDGNDPLADYKHLRWRAKLRFEQDELRRDCERLNLSMSLAQRRIDAQLTHEACLFVADRFPVKSMNFIEAVYRQRFREGDDIQDDAALTKVFDLSNIDGSEFFENKATFSERFLSHMTATLELGIHDSPCFMLNDEPFQGRQHLPLMRWRIEGENLTPPV